MDSMNEVEKKIEKIVQAIGSPWGEGAEYTRGSNGTHLDESDAKDLREDILSLIQEERQGAVEDFWAIFRANVVGNRDWIKKPAQLMEYFDEFKEEYLKSLEDKEGHE